MEDLDSISAALLSLRGNTGWEGGVKLPGLRPDGCAIARILTRPAVTPPLPPSPRFCTSAHRAAWHKQESQESRKAATAPATTAAVPAPVPAAAN